MQELDDVFWPSFASETLQNLLPCALTLLSLREGSRGTPLCELSVSTALSAPGGLVLKLPKDQRLVRVR